MVKKLPNTINSYIENGDSQSMEKVRKYLLKNIDFNTPTPESVQSFSLLDFAHWIAVHFNIDIDAIENNTDKLREQRNFIIIVRFTFITYYKVLKKQKTPKMALEFVSNFEDALDEVHTIQEGLEKLIEAMPFSKLKDECLDITAPLNSTVAKGKQMYFQWNKDELILQKLSQLLYEDYGIIRAPSRFEKLMKGTTGKRVTINRDKVAYFVFLIKKLIKDKWVTRKEGKGHWLLLTYITIDYSGKEVTKNESFFKSLSSKLGKNTSENTQIINQVEEILKEAERIL